MSLLFFPKQAIERFKMFPEIIIFDATYGTNRFKMPLLVLNAVDNFGKSFVVALGLLTRENGEQVGWILRKFCETIGSEATRYIHTVITDGDHAFANAISREMPTVAHQLCFWHIEKDVIHHVSRVAGAVKATQIVAEFKEAYSALTEELFETCWRKLEIFPSVKGYLARWYSCRTQWAYAWTKKKQKFWNPINAKSGKVAQNS